MSSRFYPFSINAETISRYIPLPSPRRGRESLRSYVQPPFPNDLSTRWQRKALLSELYDIESQLSNSFNYRLTLARGPSLPQHGPALSGGHKRPIPGHNSAKDHHVAIQAKEAIVFR